MIEPRPRRDWVVPLAAAAVAVTAWLIVLTGMLYPAHGRRLPVMGSHMTGTRRALGACVLALCTGTGASFDLAVIRARQRPL